MSRAPLLLGLALLGVAAPVLSAPTLAAEPQLAGAPFPRTSLAPSPYSRGVKSAPGGPAAPCVGPCGAPSGYGAPPPAVAYAPIAPPTYAPAFGPMSVEPPGRTVHVGTGQAATQMLNLPRGKSAVVDLPSDARDVLVTDPKVADVVLSTPRRIYVTGVASGQTDATFVDGVGRRILHLDIRVDQDWTAASDTLAKMMPGSRLKVHAANNNLLITGEASSAGEADRALKLVGSFVARPEQVVNLITLTGSDQVMLKVKIVEVNRSVTKQLGFDLGAVLGAVGGPQYSFLKGPTYGIAGALLGGLTGGYSADTTRQPTLQVPCAPGVEGDCFATFGSKDTSIGNANTATLRTTAGSQGLNSARTQIQAFERVGLIRTLAEPNLTAVSGESGRFLVGGEFPVPVAQDVTGRISVEFKPYGIGLGYTPVVLSDGRISLKMSTEVSELTNVGSFTLTTNGGGNSGGPALSIPGLSVRRAETTVELPSGGSLMIAGLLSSQTKQTLDSLPGLMQLPVLGALLRSRDFQNNETELVIIVTPYLVKAGRPDDFATPADGLKIAGDIETNLLGRLNSSFGKSAAAVAGKTYQGPFGYVVD